MTTTDQGGTGPPLLATKLHAPRRRGLVPRPRLRAQLDRREQPPLTLVSGAAGFGKTTLVASWFADLPSTAWLSLDRGDNDPATFWSYVIAAVRTVHPGSASAAAALLQEGRPSGEAIVATLLDDLHTTGEDLVLVLDDYHAIEAAEVHEGVAFLLEHLPPALRLVIATRADPPLPLAGLRARGDLLEIRAADLRFTSEEAAAYLADTMGLALPPTEVELLGARTEGWIAALQLAALSLQGRPDHTAFISAFAGDDRFVLDYLVGEVLDRQRPEIRTFLLQTSVLSRLCGPNCDAVTTGSGGRAMLEQLDRANLFLVPLDDRRTWYRYHHLFADVLRAHLLEESDQAPELHRRASTWWDAEGEPVEAITHALAGGHHEWAAQLIELAAPAMQRNRQDGALRGWLEALPDDVYADRPVLALLLVGARMSTGDVGGVEPLLALVEAALDGPSTPPLVFDQAAFARLPAHVAVQRSGLALLAGDLAGAVDHAQRVLELVGPEDHVRRGAASALIALAAWSLGDLDVAEQRYHDSVRHLSAADHLADVLGVSIALADVQMARGRLGDAEQTFGAGLQLIDEHPGLRGGADMHVGMAEVLIERNDLAGAARQLQLSADLGHRAGLPQHPYRRRVAQARLAAAGGSLAEATALLEDAVPRYDTDFSPPVCPVTSLLARAHLADGDLGAARRWATGRQLALDDELSYVDEHAHLTLARLLLAERDGDGDRPSLAGPIGLLDRLLAAAEEGHRERSAIEVLVLLAAARHAAGDRRAATEALEEAVRRAEPEGYAQVFLEVGPAIAELLHQLASTPGAPRHARALVARAPTAPEALRAAPGAPPTELVDELSARELDVLRLLRSELGGPEIARELHVSLNTLRTHTKHIYTKLDVKSRRAAVRRAAELGL